MHPPDGSRPPINSVGLAAFGGDLKRHHLALYVHRSPNAQTLDLRRHTINLRIAVHPHPQAAVPAYRICHSLLLYALAIGREAEKNRVRREREPLRTVQAALNIR